MSLHREFQLEQHHAKDLHAIAECEQEHAAITRLRERRGTDADVMLVAAMYQRVGEAENAKLLVRAALEEVA